MGMGMLSARIMKFIPKSDATRVKGELSVGVVIINNVSGCLMAKIKLEFFLHENIQWGGQKYHLRWKFDSSYHPSYFDENIEQSYCELNLKVSLKRVIFSPLTKII